MICPVCNYQMHQKNKIGGGCSNDDEYQTWTVQECPNCDRLVHESYSAKVIDKEDLDLLK